MAHLGFGGGRAEDKIVAEPLPAGLTATSYRKQQRDGDRGNTEAIQELLAVEHPWACDTASETADNIHHWGVEAFRKLADKKTYLAHYEPLAEKEWNALLERGRGSASTANVLKIARRYRFTQTGTKAAMTGFQMLFDQGQFSLATLFFESFWKEQKTELSQCNDEHTNFLIKAFSAAVVMKKSVLSTGVRTALDFCKVKNISLAGKTESIDELAEQMSKFVAKPINYERNIREAREVATYGNLQNFSQILGLEDPLEAFCFFYAKASIRDTTVLLGKTITPSQGEIDSQGANRAQIQTNILKNILASNHTSIMEDMYVLELLPPGSLYHLAQKISADDNYDEIVKRLLDGAFRHAERTGRVKRVLEYLPRTKARMSAAFRMLEDPRSFVNEIGNGLIDYPLGVDGSDRKDGLSLMVGYLLRARSSQAKIKALWLAENSLLAFPSLTKEQVAFRETFFTAVNSFLSDDDIEVRKAAISTVLAVRNVPGVISADSAVLENLTHPDGEVRKDNARIIRKVLGQDPKALKLVAEIAARETDPQVQNLMQQELQRALDYR